MNNVEYYYSIGYKYVHIGMILRLVSRKYRYRCKKIQWIVTFNF